MKKLKSDIYLPQIENIGRSGNIFAEYIFLFTYFALFLSHALIYLLD